MAGRRRRNNRGPGQVAGGRGQQPGAALPNVQQTGAAVPNVQQPGAAVPRVQQPGAAVPNVQQPGAAVPRVQQPAAAVRGVEHGDLQIKKSYHNVLTRNENMAVSEDKKVIKSGTPFRSEHTVTKLRNGELQRIYDEMKGVHKLIVDTVSEEVSAETLAVYNELMDRAIATREVIKCHKDGMALPIPNSLPKKFKL